MINDEVIIVEEENGLSPEIEEIRRRNDCLQ